MRLVCPVLVVLWLGSPARADGPCCPSGVRHPTPLDLFDEATTVARIEITTATPVAFKTIATLKGTAPTKLAPRERSMSECEPQFAAGDQALVFLDHEARFVGGFAYHGYIAKPSAELVALIDAWSKATDRAAMIAETIEKATPAIAEHAVGFLADAPALINAITSDQRDRIARAAPRLDDGSYFPFVLVRLRASTNAIPKRMHFRKRALQLARHDFDSVTDAKQLASRIAAVRIGRSARGSAAFERCERLHGKRLLTFSIPLEHVHGLDSPAWRRMVRACVAGR